MCKATYHTQPAGVEELPDGAGVFPQPLREQTEVRHDEAIPLARLPLGSVSARAREGGQGEVLAEDLQQRLWGVVIVVRLGRRRFFWWRTVCRDEEVPPGLTNGLQGWRCYGARQGFGTGRGAEEVGKEEGGEVR